MLFQSISQLCSVVPKLLEKDICVPPLNICALIALLGPSTLWGWLHSDKLDDNWNNRTQKSEGMVTFKLWKTDLLELGTETHWKHIDCLNKFHVYIEFVQYLVV